MASKAGAVGMRYVWVVLICLAMIFHPAQGRAAELKPNDVLRVPVEAGYVDFWWGSLFENPSRDLIISYNYRRGDEWETHYFNVNRAIDLDPASARSVAADAAAQRKLEATFGLHPIAADIFYTFDLPDGTRFDQDSIFTGSSCGWAYPNFIIVLSSHGTKEDLALFVRARQPMQIMLRHDCERSAGTDKVRLNFNQPLLEGFYTPRNEFFVLCAGGGVAVPCSGDPRLLHLTMGGVPDILREFDIIAVPAETIGAAYSALASEGLSAQQAIDKAESAIAAYSSKNTSPQ